MEELVEDPQPISKGEKLYKNLIGSGFTEANLGKQDEFIKALQNPIQANKIYSGLRTSGFSEKNLGTLKEFQTSFAPETKIDNASLGLSPTSPNLIPNQSLAYSPIIDEITKKANESHANAIAVAQQQRQIPREPKTEKEDRGIMDKVSQALYIPAIKQGFNDLIVTPLAGATDFLDRTTDKAYQAITGEKTPEWLREGGIFRDVSNQIQKEYETREKPTNIVSDVAEGVIGTLPLMASMYTGQGEASIAMKAPQLFGKLSKVLATTKGLSAYKEATDNKEGYLQSLTSGLSGAAKGGLEGQLMEAQMLVGGALGKGVANKLAEKGLLKGGKAANAVLHALSVGTVFGGTSAGEDLLSGKDIDTDEALKQFGTGLAFELIPTAKGIHEELKDRADGKKINNQAAQAAAVANSVSNMNGESVLRTLINTPIEQITQVNDNIKKGHEDLYAESIENGAKAYETKDINEKRDLYTNQLALKAQGDIKMVADMAKSDPTEIINSINENTEIPPELKQDLINKIESLTPKRQENENNESSNGEMGELQSRQENGQSGSEEVNVEVRPEENGQKEVNRQRIPDTDAPEVTELARNIKEVGSPGFSVEPSYERTYEKPHSLTDNELDNGNKYIVSRGEDGKVNGVLEISYNGEKGLSKEPTDIKVAVAEDSRRKGIATNLFKHAEESGIDLSKIRGKSTTDAGQALFEANIKSNANKTTAETGGNDRTVESIAEPVQQPKVAEAQTEKTTRARNATTDEIADKLGVKIDIGSEKRSREVVEAEADKVIKEGYDIDELINKIQKDKHEASDTETIILAKHLGAQNSALEDINKRIASEGATMKDKDFQELANEKTRLLNEFQEGATALKNTGRAIARGLGARRFIVKDNVDLADMIVRKREANKGEKLTPEQLKEVNDAYEDIKTKAEAYEKKIAELQAQETDLLAKQALRKAKLEVRNSKRSVKSEVIDKEIDDVFASIKKIAKEQRSTLSANPIPVEYLPQIAKLVKLYTQKGVNSVEGIVDNIYNGLKDDIEGLTKDHVKEAVGLAGEKDPLKAVKSRLRTSISDLKRRTEEKDFSPRKREPIKLDKEGLELRDALEKARYEYELALHRDALKNRTKLQKRRDELTEIANVPRALMASTDFSAPLRQGLVMTVSHPIRASKAFIHMFKSAASTKTFDRWFYDLKESPDYATMKEAKLYIADPHKPELAAKEEQFMTNVANKIPLMGKLVEGSERAYVAYLNKLRVDLFRQMSEVYENSGKTPSNNPDLYKGLAKFINNATGRGDFKNENMAQALNTILFSPRLIASRLNLLNPRWYAKLPKEVRRQAIGDMIKFTAVGISVLALAQLNGADVETDPRSSDFGKIKVGDTRYDIWGGFAQYARLFAQLLTNETKSTRTGRITELGDSKPGARTRLDVLGTFARNKLSPVPAYGFNYLSGKDAVGQKFEPIEAIPKSLWPLVVQDTYKSVQDEGLKGLFTTGVPAAFGVGVNTYSDKR